MSDCLPHFRARGKERLKALRVLLESNGACAEQVEAVFGGNGSPAEAIGELIERLRVAGQKTTASGSDETHEDPADSS